MSPKPDMHTKKITMESTSKTKVVKYVTADKCKLTIK